MNKEEKLRYELAKELTDLWYECKVRCEKIEEIAKKISKNNEIDIIDSESLFS